MKLPVPGRRMVVGPASFGHLLLHTTENSRQEKLPLRDGNILLTAATRLDHNPLPTAPDSSVLLEVFVKQFHLAVGDVRTLGVPGNHVLAQLCQIDHKSWLMRRMGCVGGFGR